MAKGHRGKGIKNLPYRGRGTCPLCKRTGVKTLYEVQVKEQTVKVCKPCKAVLSGGKQPKVEATA